VLVLLVYVDEALLAHHADKAAPRVHFLREKDRRPVVVRTVDCQSWVGDFLFCIDKEGVVHDVFGDVTLHILGLFTIILQIFDDFQDILLASNLILGVNSSATSWLAVGICTSEGRVLSHVV